jgi:branched-chain amino acid transport system ATP-binding protein
MLKLTEVSAGYGQKQILHNISLEIKSGEIVAILGPNGAGKSTLLKVMSGLLTPFSGDVCFNQQKITNLPAYRRARIGIGFVMQEAPLFESLTIAEHRRLAGGGTGGTDAEFLEAAANKYGGVLSGGERRCLAIELCLSRHPKLLLLDEPSAGVSPNVALEIYAWIKSRIEGTATAALVVEHNLRFLPDFATRLTIMRQGTVAYDSLPLSTLHNSEQMFELFYGNNKSTG